MVYDITCSFRQKNSENLDIAFSEKIVVLSSIYKLTVLSHTTIVTNKMLTKVIFSTYELVTAQTCYCWSKKIDWNLICRLVIIEHRIMFSLICHVHLHYQAVNILRHNIYCSGNWLFAQTATILYCQWYVIIKT